MQQDILDKLHKVEIEILDEIVRICEQHHLTYFLAGGTLLGAVRHKGFIPWDDDLDVAMPREDYERFCDLCKEELQDSYYLHSKEIDSQYWLPFVKVRKKGTIFDEALLKNVQNKFNGIWVDIFPLDYSVTENSKGKRCRTYLYKQLMYLISYRSHGVIPKKIISKSFFYATRYINISTFRKWQDWLMTRENAQKERHFFVNFASQYRTIKQTMPIEVYLPASKILFCGKMYSAPHDTEAFLKRLYGSDYMLYPPFEKRMTHNPYRLSFDASGPDEPLSPKKKYKVGYTTGVFDLFHIGHLNILKRAKEQCDYLIVGVSTDENVMTYKHKQPVIPFEQRKAILESIRYVDQVVPQENMDKLKAWEQYHFDVMFHGSDWKGSTMYNEIEAQLKAVGCDTVFLPHTDGISSSMLSKIGMDGRQ